ncbi:MAG: lysoplasmalogenase, partial [Bacteroidota bacterium]
ICFLSRRSFMTTKNFEIRSSQLSSPYLILFFLASLIELLWHLFTGWSDYIHYLAKSLLMPSLLLYFLTQAREREWEFKAKIPIICALVFSFGGDFFLLFPGSDFFLLGLGSFLIAQICYVYTFRKGPFIIEKGRLGSWQFVLGTLLLFFAGAFLYMLSPYLAALKIPVFAYTGVISLMGLSALSRSGKVSQTGFCMVVLGAFLFILSDSLIAFTRFRVQDLWVEISYSGFWIMLTYILAQYFIIRGLLRS